VKNVSKLFTNFFGIIAVSAIMVCAFAACSDGGGGSDNEGPVNITVPRVEDLPEFPEGTRPATTISEVNSILSALAFSRTYDFVHERISETIDDIAGYRNNYSFTDKEDYDKKIKVSASLKSNVSMSRNFEDLFTFIYEYGADPMYYTNTFTTGDYYRVSGESKKKGILTQNITYGSVTIAAKSIFGEQRNSSENVQITKRGSVITGEANVNISENYQQALGFTVTASGKSVKIILDLKTTATASGNNTQFYWLLEGVWEDLPASVTAEVKYSGSLKVYGENNELLKTLPITSFAACEQALETLGIPPNFSILME